MSKQDLPATTVPINGPALRELRVRTGVSAASLAAELEISRTYLSMLETGVRRRVSPPLFQRIMLALRVQDRRVLLGDLTEVA